MLDTLTRIHALGIAHGDLHPQNIIVKEDGAAVLIDVLDFRLDADDHYTTAYLPENYKSLTPFERDRYGIAAVLTELLQCSRQKPTSGEYPIPRIYEEIANLLEQRHCPLEPLSRAIAAAGQADEAELLEITVVVQKLAQSGVVSGEMRSDNGTFHVEAKEDKKYKGGLRFWVTGIGKQLSFSWKLTDDAAEFVRASSISQSQLLRSQTMADGQIPVRIHLVDGPVSDVRNLSSSYFQDERIKRSCLSRYRRRQSPPEERP